MAEGQKAAPGCELAPPVPLGTVIRDTRLKKWTVGKPIGAGGFGAIYLCDRGEQKDGISDDAEFVVKIEPHSNGPLFVEMHVFLRLGLEEHMATWQPRQKDKPQGWVGIPRFHGSGSVDVADTKLRFVVMTRFASDLEKFFKSGSKPLPLATVLNIAVQVINSVEYIHSKHYTHNDIKAQNILLDSGGCDVFLVDFGLACKYKDNFGFHCDGGGDERKAHEGTLEYTSRDAHIGAHSRRGDLETLGFCLVHWASGFLPWKETEDPEFVQAQKNGFLENVETFLVKCFKPAPYPEILKEYFDYICELEFKTKPDYKYIRKMLGQAMDDLGSAPHTKLQFGKKTKIRKSRKSDAFPIIMEEEQGRATRSKDDGNKVFWQDILDPESIMKSASRSNFDEDSCGVDPQQEAAEQERQMAALANPTPEMLKLIDAKRKLEEVRQQLGWKEQLAEYNKRNVANKLRFASMDLTPNYNTPVMEEVIASRAARLARDNHTPEPSDDEMEDDVFNGTVIEKNLSKDISKISFMEEDLLHEDLSPFPQSRTTHTPVDRILRSRTTTPKDSHSTPTELPGSGSVTPKTKSRSVTPSITKSTPRKGKSRSNTPNISTTNTPEKARLLPSEDVVDLTTPVVPAKTRKVVTLLAKPLPAPTPAVATRTRNRGRTVSECLPEVVQPPSSLPTPSATAPSSPQTPGQKYSSCTVCSKTMNVKSLSRHYRSVHSMAESPSSLPIPAANSPSSPLPSPQTPGQKYTSCTECSKTMNDKSLARHYRSVHSMKRPLSATPSRHSGLTPKLKRGRVTPKHSPNTDTQPPPLLRHQTPMIGQEQEILLRRRKEVINSELNPADSPSRNIRMAPCPLCGMEIAKSLIPKHFQDSHSPTAHRRTRKKMEAVTGAMARVAVTTDTPEKIRNFDSPAKQNISKETVGNIVSTFRRGLVL